MSSPEVQVNNLFYGNEDNSQVFKDQWIHKELLGQGLSSHLQRKSSCM